CFCFFFSSRRRHTRFSRDWSSDVCSSDLRDEIQDVNQVSAFVRPHDVELTRDGAAGLPAVRVEHIQPVGSVIRIELKLTETVQADPIQVEIPRRDYEALSLRAGEQVYLRLLHGRVFPTTQAVG